MNALWNRAECAGRLKSMFVVLKRELLDMEQTKQNEKAAFEKCQSDPKELLTYQKNSGLTLDICTRILSEVVEDLALCVQKLAADPPKNALDGEKDLKALYNTPERIVWEPTQGSTPTDIIIVSPTDPKVLLGDCKFGLKSHEAGLFRNEMQFHKEFWRKFSAVAALLRNEDNVESSARVLLVVTSAMAPLMKNRLSDYQLEGPSTNIPYDKIEVCSVEDIDQIAQSICG